VFHQMEVTQASPAMVVPHGGSEVGSLEGIPPERATMRVLLVSPTLRFPKGGSLKGCPQVGCNNGGHPTGHI
jgi:hypothetical protein